MRVSDPDLTDEQIVRDYRYYLDMGNHSVAEPFSHDGKLKKQLGQIGTVYISQSEAKSPRWQSTFFNNEIDVFGMSVGAALICRFVVENVPEIFVLTFGAQGRFIVEQDCLDDGFGIRTALSLMDSNRLRQISKSELLGSNRITQQQVSKASSIRGFDLDPFADYLKTITGSAEDESIRGMIKGSQALSLSVEGGVFDILPKLEEIALSYRSKRYKTNFDWIDNLRLIKNKKLIGQLDELAVGAMNAGNGTVWLAMPDIIDMKQLEYFSYLGIESDDVYLSELLSRGIQLSVDDLKKEVKALGPDGVLVKRWSLKKCLCGEVERNGELYGISDGSWFEIDRNYANRARMEYEQMPVSECRFEPFDENIDVEKRESGTVSSEGKYLQRIVNLHPEEMILLDRKLVQGFELCDVVMKSALVHVKRYSSSGVLSHLFFQGLNSARMLDDAEFCREANSVIRQSGGNQEYYVGNDYGLKKIVFAITSKEDGERPHLPAFSMISLSNTLKALSSLGYECEIAKIPVIRKKK